MRRSGGRWWICAAVFVLAAPLPVAAGGILLAERGPTLRTVLVLAVGIAAAAACVAGVVAAINVAINVARNAVTEAARNAATDLAAEPGVEQPNMPLLRQAPRAGI
ncbi:hypothetical protein Vau01_123640 [Virgisporangium aurantiacum]|uniref:Uncharacterized protein n=1 Tax=Virgisporangium aurantiacum TaxID=175570 RepID=A0A8J3ZL84_9ACTN|nr:hypothetical protein Vau01_123640 [Virgisporangium aurantiacum]